MGDGPSKPTGVRLKLGLELTALCFGWDVGPVSKLPFISLAVFLNANSLACLALLIWWGGPGQQIAQPHSADDTDKTPPTPVSPDKNNASSLTGLWEERAGSRRYQSCLAPPHPPAGPWWHRLCCRRRKCSPGDK